MLSLALSAVVLGGLANLALAVAHLLGMRKLKPITLADTHLGAGLGYLRATNFRYVYLYGFFAAVSFTFPRSLVTTVLGIALGAGICGFLLIQTVSFVLSPNKTDRRTPFAVTGAACYAYSVYVGLNI